MLYFRSEGLRNHISNSYSLVVHSASHVIRAACTGPGRPLSPCPRGLPLPRYRAPQHPPYLWYPPRARPRHGPPDDKGEGGASREFKGQ